MMWHNTKTDPPKKSGQYAVVFRESLCCPWEKYTYLDGEWRNENGVVVPSNDLYYPTWWMEIVGPDDVRFSDFVDAYDVVGQDGDIPQVKRRVT